jgi:D-sedoheptulose 7-phosphate isomerase
MNYTQKHLDEAALIISKLDQKKIEQLVETLANVRKRGGRLFFLGVGGSAGNCGHAVNDFRKLAHFEAYAPTDNVSELTARTNDEGWDSVFVEWLKGSRLRSADAVFVLSVRDGGYTAKVADACVIIPTVNPDTVTPHSEAFQAVVWHLLVSHPLLKSAPTKWESTR